MLMLKRIRIIKQIYVLGLSTNLKIRQKVTVPEVPLNNGQKIPILGLGTWNSPPGQVKQAVKDAIDVGYRHIDCAHVYENEHEVGQGIAEKIAEGKIKREDLFITSKLWNTHHRPNLVLGACKHSLENLCLQYLDLYLIHWPMGYKDGDELFPVDKNKKTVYSDADYVQTWKEMEKLVNQGLCCTIGVSNFNSKQIERVLKVATIKPAMNQIECHPYLTQKKLIKFCKDKKIAITAYSPLGSPNRPWAKKGDPVIMEDPKIVSMAKKYKKNPAQILIRYQIEVGNAVIPKSVTKSRIASNFDVFDFKLTPEDVCVIDDFNVNGRLVPVADDCDHPHYPFKEEF